MKRDNKTKLERNPPTLFLKAQAITETKRKGKEILQYCADNEAQKVARKSKESNKRKILKRKALKRKPVVMLDKGKDEEKIEETPVIKATLEET